MRHLGLRTIALNEIDDSDRLRAIDEDRARLLAENIADTGHLRQPIEIQLKGGLYRLIAGGHRLRAAHILGWTHISAFVFNATADEARLLEIDENIQRNELNPLDRAVFLAERERVYLRLNPQAGHGGARGNQYTGGKKRQDDIVSFCQNTAERCGITPRTIARAKRIAGLSADLRDRLAGTWLAKHQAALLALVATPEDERAAVVDLLLSGVAKTVAEARAKLANAADPLSDDRQKKVDALRRAWNRAMRPGRKAWVAQMREEDLVELRALVAEALAGKLVEEAA
ncbi:MAG: ParB N-terminal domain-containing protein [Alphaproteobacteria bacterium]|nr:ParB N-terminal domain-containing protein [Alphaproteobacteria bacterium]